MPAKAAADLRARGHDLDVTREGLGFGGGQIIMVHPESGVLWAAQTRARMAARWGTSTITEDCYAPSRLHRSYRLKPTATAWSHLSRGRFSHTMDSLTGDGGWQGASSRGKTKGAVLAAQQTGESPAAGLQRRSPGRNHSRTGDGRLGRGRRALPRRGRAQRSNRAASLAQSRPRALRGWPPRQITITRQIDAGDHRSDRASHVRLRSSLDHVPLAARCARRVVSGSRWPRQQDSTSRTAAARSTLCPIDTKSGLVPSLLHNDRPNHLSRRRREERTHLPLAPAPRACQSAATWHSRSSAGRAARPGDRQGRSDVGAPAPAHPR